MSEFVGPFELSDASLLEQQTTESFESKFEGWSPAAGSPIAWLSKAFSRVGAQVFDQASLLLRSAFQRFGEAVVSVPPIQAAPATVSSTWTMIDEDGHEIPAGTQVAIPVDGDTSLPFRTVEVAVVPPESDTVSIQLEAIEPGEQGNGLTADASLVTGLGFVVSPGIELEGATANGVDEEEEDAYLDRLVDAIQLRSSALIKGRDFAIDARAVPGISRAHCIEAFNITAGAEGEEEAGAVSVVPLDEAGADLSEGIEDDLQERQEEKVLSGIKVYVGKATRTKVQAKTKIEVKVGFDKPTVVAAVEARYDEYLDPAKWATPEAGDPSGAGGLELRDTVYRFELLSEIDRVGGVDRVVTLELSKEGSGLGTSDVALAGAVPLTEPGAFTVETV